MPAMVRPPGKGKKIAFNLLGVPPSLQKSTKKQTDLEKRIDIENTQQAK